MDFINQKINEINDLVDSLKNNYLTSEQANSEIERIKKQCNSIITPDTLIKSNELKSLIIVFNQNNYSNLTIFFSKSDNSLRLIETTGENILIENVLQLLNDDNDFYRSIEKIELNGNNYRVFYESMPLDDVVYTILSLTNSINFKSSEFHVLCDIIMDYTKSSRISKEGIFCDLFDDTLIEMNRYISDSYADSPLVYYFRYEYITDFFQKIGLATLIEMSDNLKLKLVELFGIESYIIRISLSSFVVIAIDKEEKRNFNHYLNKNKINFVFKGIVLPYMVIQIPYEKNYSSYDIFENVYLLDNYLQSGDVRI